jgi:hypothetical protein
MLRSRRNLVETPHRTYRQAVMSVLFIVALLSSLAVVSTAQVERGRPQPYVMSGTETVTFTSNVNAGQEYVLYVQLPQRYAESDQHFPVIYVLDGQWDFTLVTALYGQQYYDGFVPASIVVGITWGGSNPKHDSLRAGDLTPTHSKAIPQSGHGPAFLKVVTTEAIPLIESSYRALPTGRTLIGSSFGGLFTLFALFQETRAFDRFVAASPAIRWAEDAMITEERRFAERVRSLPARVFIAHGGMESNVEAFQRFVSSIESRHYAGLEMQTRLIEGAGHSGAKAEGFTRGLQWVFARPDLSLDPEILDRCAGEYQVNADITVKLWRSDRTLMARYPGGPEVRLTAASETEFYIPGIFLKVKFEVDESGTVKGLLAEEYGRTTYAKKIQ